MAHNDFAGEEPINYEQKCPCVLVLDVSGSMSGKPIRQLNEGLKEFREEILNDETACDRLEVSIVTFGSDIDEVQSFSLLENFEMPELKINGSTRLVDGAKEGLRLIEERKKWYKSTGQTYYRPYVILMTDGYPDGGQDIDGLSIEVNQGVDNKKFNFWAFGVEGADMNMLEKISHPQFKPLKLKGLDFVKFFKWLSSSMSSIAASHDGDNVDISPKSENDNPFQITI
ncbi:vWA domain-containing protein [Kordia jejudonensis]|uniref:vWA domain-containing protein n=1 Tax=Kordia jejudonensis TaxID=1348245 RepID=UPI0006293481|nr:VWA domain-containing protein [Kordia jejudonensis]